MRLHLPKLLASLAATFFAAFIGSLATTPSVTTWYANLMQPPLTPPGWVFGPVWTLLYLLMAIALYRVWNKPGSPARLVALGAYATQLILNAAWSQIFFRLHLPGYALFDIVLLGAAIVWTMIAFHRLDKTASYLLAPYLAWVSFATYLNAGIWLLNR